MNKEKYDEVFKTVFDMDVSEFDDSFTFKSIEKWDSLIHLTLISELEATFDVMFETGDILNFGGYENGMKILEKYGIDFNE